METNIAKILGRSVTMNAVDVEPLMSGLFYVTIGSLVFILSLVISCLIVPIFWRARIKSLVYLAFFDIILLFILVFLYTR